MGNDFLVKRADLDAMLKKHGGDGGAFWEAIATPIVRRLEFNEKVDRPLLESLTPGQAAVASTWDFYKTMRGRGLLDYLFYRGSNLPWALAGLKTLGAEEQAAQLEGCLRGLFGDQVPKYAEDWTKLARKKETKEKLLAASEAFSRKFAAQEDYERPLAELVVGYVNKHPEQFCSDLGPVAKVTPPAEKGEKAGKKAPPPKGKRKPVKVKPEVLAALAGLIELGERLGDAQTVNELGAFKAAWEAGDPAPPGARGNVKDASDAAFHRLRAIIFEPDLRTPKPGMDDRVEQFYLRFGAFNMAY